jgi:hypothetical protein
MPNAYVITAIAPSSVCSGASEYELTNVTGIHAPILVCSISPIPNAYAITAIAPSSVCSGANEYELTNTTGLLGQLLVCYVSPIPNLYAIVAAVPYPTQCQGENGFNIKYYFDQQAIDVCSITPALNGYVVTSSRYGLPCGGAETWTYERPSDYLAICPFSPIPFGWTSVGTSATGSCSGFSPAYIIVKGSDAPGIFASPNPVPFSRLAGVTQISWSAPGAGLVDIYVSINGATHSFWMTGNSLGSAQYGDPGHGQGIIPPNVFTFQLYRAGTTNPLLSSVSVTMAPQ